jgi:hypothetical protein
LWLALCETTGTEEKPLLCVLTAHDEAAAKKPKLTQIIRIELIADDMI